MCEMTDCTLLIYSRTPLKTAKSWGENTGSSGALRSHAIIPSALATRSEGVYVHPAARCFLSTILPAPNSSTEAPDGSAARSVRSAIPVGRQGMVIRPPPIIALAPEFPERGPGSVPHHPSSLSELAHHGGHFSSSGVRSACGIAPVSRTNHGEDRHAGSGRRPRRASYPDAPMARFVGDILPVATRLTATSVAKRDRYHDTKYSRSAPPGQVLSRGDSVAAAAVANLGDPDLPGGSTMDASIQ